MPSAMTKMLSKNGTRQPQLKKSSFGMDEKIANTPCASKMPSVTPMGANAPYSPRLPGGAYSTARITAPPYSAPAPKPCTKRSTTNRIGAQMPMAS